MAKALVVGFPSSPGSGAEANLFGYISNTTESSAQVQATEGASFTGLGFRITANGSGVNTVRFRDAGADGQNVASRTGVGAAEDTTNTDTLSAGDLFNLAFTDTGTTPTFSFVRANIELASGHGSIHCGAAYNGVICDVPSTTRYHAVNGNIIADGAATIAQAQWKNRGYTSLEAFQVRVTANARTNNSVFSVNINGSNVGTAITYGSGVSGLQVVTGMGISLSDGDLICVSMALGTGVEDITVTLVGVTLKSTAGSSEIAANWQAGTAQAASATPTYCVPGGVVSFNATETNQRIKVGFSATCRNLRCYLSANTYTADATLKLMVSGTARITTTLTAGGGAGWYENAADTFDITDADEISYEIVGGTSGSITVHSIGVTFDAPPPSAGQPYAKRTQFVPGMLGFQNRAA